MVLTRRRTARVLLLLLCFFLLLVVILLLGGGAETYSLVWVVTNSIPFSLEADRSAFRCGAVLIASIYSSFTIENYKHNRISTSSFSDVRDEIKWMIWVQQFPPKVNKLVDRIIIFNNLSRNMNLHTSKSKSSFGPKFVQCPTHDRHF